MILVHVKNYEEMKATADYTGNGAYAEAYWKTAYGDKTVVYLNETPGEFQYSSIEFYDESDDLKNEPILSFEEFSQRYPNEPVSKDMINHPSHYKQFSREVIDTMQGVSTSEEFKGYLKLNAIKYISRYQGKNGAEDLEKAIWYINKLKEVVESEGISTTK